MVWEEKNGPVVEKTGFHAVFGTRSVIASIESQLGGQAEFDWRATGLICRLSVSADAGWGRASAQRSAKMRSSAGTGLSWHRGPADA